MRWDRFLMQIGLVTLVTAGVLYGLTTFFPVLHDTQILSWVSLAALLVLSILMFYFGRQAAMSDNKNSFTNVVVGFVIGKMAICVAIILVYNQNMQPATKHFLIPFFLIYLVYTVYESIFMIRLGKMQS